VASLLWLHIIGVCHLLSPLYKPYAGFQECSWPSTGPVPFLALGTFQQGAEGFAEKLKLGRQKAEMRPRTTDHRTTGPRGKSGPGFAWFRRGKKGRESLKSKVQSLRLGSGRGRDMPKGWNGRAEGEGEPGRGGLRIAGPGINYARR